MANIQSNLNKIKNAVLGVEVRDSIHDGIKAMNEEVEKTTEKQKQLEGTFDELIDARVGMNGLSYSNLGGAIRGQVKDLHDVIKSKYVNITPTAGYIKKNGTITTDVDIFSHSQPIQLLKNQTIILYGRGYNQNVSMISTCDVNGNNIKVEVLSMDSEFRTYEYTATEDCYVILSFDNRDEALRAVIYNDYKALLEDMKLEIKNIEKIFREDISITPTTGYVRQDGTITTDVDIFSYSQPIQLLKNQTIILYGRGYNQNVSMISTCDVNGNNIKVEVLSIDSDEREYKYTASEDCYVILSFDNRSPINAYIIKNLFEQQNEIDNVNYMQIFHKIAGIGDSLMSGELAQWSDAENKYIYTDCYKYSWLSNLCKNIGAEPVHYSVGGRTTKKWLDNELSVMKSETVKPSAYFIALGTNDINQVPLGVESDCDTDNETFYGMYSKIIKEVQVFNPNATIFCMSLYFKSTDTSTISYSNAVKYMAKKYGCYYVDFINTYGYKYDSTNDKLYIKGGHFTTVGYVKVAEQILTLTNKIVKDNYDKLAYIALNYMDI